jgi:hypothetical protein
LHVYACVTHLSSFAAISDYRDSLALLTEEEEEEVVVVEVVVDTCHHHVTRVIIT